MVADGREIVADHPRSGWAGQRWKNLRGRDEPRWRSRRGRRVDRLDDHRTRAPIYLFETLTGKMIARIVALPDVTHSLAFSPDGRYLAAGLWRGTVCAFMTETGNGARFSATPTMAIVSTVLISPPMVGWPPRASTAQVRLYDRDFKQIVAPRKPTGGAQPFRIAFSPDGATLAVGYNDTARVDLLDGHSLAPLPGPNVDDIRSGNLFHVAWSKDGRTLYAGGRFNEGWRVSGSSLGPCGSRRAPNFASRPQYSRWLGGLAGRSALGCCARPVFGAIGARRPTSLGASFAQGRLSRSKGRTEGVDRRHHCRFRFRASGKVATSLRSACAQA